MEAKPTLNNAIALIRYCPDENSLVKALDLCQGLQGIKFFDHFFTHHPIL